MLQRNLNKLILKEAYARDVGRFFARVDYEVMDQIGISTGSPIILQGSQKCLARCFPLYPSDEHKRMVRVDGLIRENLGNIIGEEITVEKIKCDHAMNVTVRPLEAVPPLDEKYIRECLNGVPVIAGMIFGVPYFGHTAKFAVVKTIPENPVVVSIGKTGVTISD